MVSFREMAKRKLPPVVKELVIKLREGLSAPPLEDIVIHDYQATADPTNRHRLSLVIPSLNPAKAFGGITTGVEIFLGIGRQTGAELRIILDDFERSMDISVLEKRAQMLDLAPN